MRTSDIFPDHVRESAAPIDFEIWQALEAGDHQRASELIELRDSRIDWGAGDAPIQ